MICDTEQMERISHEADRDTVAAALRLCCAELDSLRASRDRVLKVAEELEALHRGAYIAQRADRLAAELRSAVGDTGEEKPNE